ncbi:class I SAM-dependent methyltransferase [Jeotgalibacillus sp. S-D1]|uniref:class I SAM-dependent methyltransferase n=1 Tax=Jeotgalibacillus sp. S-D1 TaxID=2552189 RepID=UPI001059531C|nr:methyltransferase domain-containing protein [Jeotgalibacillus sp. S-D1]TDL31869.1 class I SAM-dependent methyltransferase [Jeotgalibacillus sp. S-D1]
MNDHEYDRLLRINPTNGLHVLSSSVHQNQYEATPYEALEALCREYTLSKKDELVDYGCGKGRVSFFLHHRTGLSVTGIEASGHLYQEALENQASYLAKRKNAEANIRFERCLAEEYQVESAQNKFYFFNPFSIQLFIRVMNNIIISNEKEPRPIDIILYYPTAEYLQYLNDQTAFNLLMEVKVPGLYEKNENERFLIYRLG